jgi:hypothetical protein
LQSSSTQNMATVMYTIHPSPLPTSLPFLQTPLCTGCGVKFPVNFIHCSIKCLGYFLHSPTFGLFVFIFPFEYVPQEWCHLKLNNLFHSILCWPLFCASTNHTETEMINQNKLLINMTSSELKIIQPLRVAINSAET